MYIVFCALAGCCYYYIRLTAFFPGQPWYAGTRKVNHPRF